MTGGARAQCRRPPADGGVESAAPSMSAARRVLADVFGFETFRPGQ